MRKPTGFNQRKRAKRQNTPAGQSTLTPSDNSSPAGEQQGAVEAEGISHAALSAMLKQIAANPSIYREVVLDCFENAGIRISPPLVCADALLSKISDSLPVPRKCKSSTQSVRGPPANGPRFLRFPQVAELVGYGRTQIYELIAKGEFPRAVKLSESGRAVAWDEEELLEWRKSRLAARG